MTAASTGLRAAVWAALATVRDPELDEPITSLDFVQDVELRGAAVTVDLRLPTYFCAPNFAYLMVADALDAVRAVAGVDTVAVRLLDHFASEEINAGVSTASGFSGSFPGLADGELEQLRLTFRRKAHQACQERVAAALIRQGWGLDRLAAASLADAPPGPDLDRLERRRSELGLPARHTDPLVVDDAGKRVGIEDLPLTLRFARATRVSIEGNAALCRGLLAVRYGPRQNPSDVSDPTGPAGRGRALPRARDL
jgi:metal-sulfur cluster biosynthetic enzyme